MERSAKQVTEEIERVLNHVGLNPDDTLDVRTNLWGYHYTSYVKGVDHALARLALTAAFLGRPTARFELDRDTLIVIQPDRW